MSVKLESVRHRVLSSDILRSDIRRSGKRSAPDSGNSLKVAWPPHPCTSELGRGMASRGAMDFLEAVGLSCVV